jgi:hypothetical protein
MSGWIKVHRKILDHWIGSEPELMAMFVRLVLDASYKDKTVNFNKSLVSLKRGQLIFGRVSFAQRSGISQTKLRRYLKMLETDQVIDQVVTMRYTLITILNYDDYQNIDQVIDQPVTSTQPALDQPVTTTKEVKESKEVKKIPFDDFWMAYPRKQGKDVARKKWSRLSLDEQMIIMDDFPRRYANGDPAFIPYGSTYLNKRSTRKTRSRRPKPGSWPNI